jgi:hypothetical protein
MFARATGAFAALMALGMMEPDDDELDASRDRKERLP